MIKMMIIMLFLSCYGFCVKIHNPIMTFQDKNRSPLKQKQSVSNQKSKKIILKEKYQKLEEQHLIVMVLAKQYNQELNKLKSFESVFCNYFDLDIKKWRKNLYIWDDLSETFLERNLKKENSKKTPSRKNF